MKRILKLTLAVFCTLYISCPVFAVTFEKTAAPRFTPSAGNIGRASAGDTASATSADAQSIDSTPEQRETAYNEISGQTGDVIRAVYLLNDRIVAVAVMEGSAKGYARKFIERYGSYVAVCEVNEPFDEDKWRESLMNAVSAGDGNTVNGKSPPEEEQADSGLTNDAAVERVYAQWEQAGYPDDIGGVYYDNGLCINVVSPTPQRIDELRALLGENTVINPCVYSYNELMRVSNEIASGMGPDNKIYSVGVGWHGSETVSGFGESGKEFRVVAGVDESEYNRYSAELTERYGDMVYVEASGEPVADVDESQGTAVNDVNKNNGIGRLWLWVVIGIVLFGALVAMIWQKYHKWQ